MTEERSQGFRDALKRCKDGIRIVASQPADFLPDKGLSVMENILQAQEDIDAVYTHDDDMAEGVVSAIENANRQDEMFLPAPAAPGRDGQDRAGRPLPGDVPLQPVDVRVGDRLARLIARGEGLPDLAEPEVPSRIQVPATTVTQENVADVKELGY